MASTEPTYALTRPIFVDRSHLVVEDLEGLRAFYISVIGLGEIERSASGVVLGAGGRPLLTLTTRSDATRAPRSASGLFHHAFLVPSRADLARWLVHAVESGVRIEGASDHLVSEAIYLSDPEGNGIEVYADRDPEQWVYQQDGTVEMATLRLNLQALHDSAPKTEWTGMPAGTAIGHIHLQVGALPATDSFYRDGLGLPLMARYPGASFFGAGGYHHHVAANIWNSRGAAARSETMTGLAEYTLGFNDPAARETMLAALDRLGIAVTRTAEGHAFRDPSGIGIRLFS